MERPLAARSGFWGCTLVGGIRTFCPVVCDPVVVSHSHLRGGGPTTGPPRSRHSAAFHVFSPPLNTP